MAPGFKLRRHFFDFKPFLILQELALKALLCLDYTLVVGCDSCCLVHLELPLCPVLLGADMLGGQALLLGFFFLFVP